MECLIISKMFTSFQRQVIVIKISFNLGHVEMSATITPKWLKSKSLKLIKSQLKDIVVIVKTLHPLLLLSEEHKVHKIGLAISMLFLLVLMTAKIVKFTKDSKTHWKLLAIKLSLVSQIYKRNILKLQSLSLVILLVLLWLLFKPPNLESFSPANLHSN